MPYLIRKKKDTEDEDFKKIIKCSPDVKPDESLPRFGPFYGNDQLAVSGTKKKAWQHVKYNRSSSDPDVGSAKEIFAAAIRRVEKEAKETYGEKITGCTSSEFRLMMVKDGCFFLQLAFLILGKSSALGYSMNDPIFGAKLKKKDRRKWIESMFYVGNQIPLVVLNELMKQKFFQDVIAKGKWDDHPPTSSLCKKVFYALLVLSPQPKIHCHHLLHGLRKLVVGPAPSVHKSAFKKKKLQIEDTNDDDFDDLEANNNNNIEDGGQERSFVNAGHKGIFPSATELRQANIVIKKLKSGDGIRSIHFRSYYFRAYLYLPVLPVEDYIEILFRNLKTYEIINRKNRRVSSYLRLMSDIIQTPQDVKLLKQQGIIQGNDDDAEKLPSILKRLISSEDDQVTTMTHEFHIMKRNIRDYSSPFVHYRGILNVVVILTLVQSFFAVLAYFQPPKQH